MSKSMINGDDRLRLAIQRSGRLTDDTLSLLRLIGLEFESYGQRLLSRCRDEQVRVILLGIPACTAHRQEFTPAIEQEYLSYIERLVQEFGCRFVDAITVVRSRPAPRSRPPGR